MQPYHLLTYPSRSIDFPLPRITSVRSPVDVSSFYMTNSAASWLLDHGKPEEGLKTLARLHANGNVNDPWVQAEFDQIQESITHEHEHEAKSYGELFTNRSSFRRLVIACALQASTQMTGVSAIQYYSVRIYGQIGISTEDTLKYQAINNIIGLLGQLCCVLLIDRFGRRKPLISGNLVNMVCFLIACILVGKFCESSCLRIRN